MTNDESPLTSLPKSSANRKVKISISLLVVACIIFIISTITLAFLVNEYIHAETCQKKNQAIDMKDLSYFFQISDVHLDVLYSKYVSRENCMCRNATLKSPKCWNKSTTSVKPVILTNGFAEFGRVNCDASEALVKSAAKYMQEIAGNLTKLIDFIILSDEKFFWCLRL